MALILTNSAKLCMMHKTAGSGKVRLLLCCINLSICHLYQYVNYLKNFFVCEFMNALRKDAKEHVILQKLH